jgi:hypothetical protein
VHVSALLRRVTVVNQAGAAARDAQQACLDQIAAAAGDPF